jgi:hypothetical protein
MPVTRWEYARLRARYEPAELSWRLTWIDPDGSEGDAGDSEILALNRAGRAGWELATFAESSDGQVTRYTFKRPVADPG